MCTQTNTKSKWMGFFPHNLLTSTVSCPATFEALLICLDDAFEEKRVLLHVGVLGGLQLGQGQEHGAATGHIHVIHWPLEGGRGQVWAKGIDDVLPVVLIQQHKCHLENRTWQGGVTAGKNEASAAKAAGCSNGN